jgi:hypothetical protein
MSSLKKQNLAQIKKLQAPYSGVKANVEVIIWSLSEHLLTSYYIASQRQI